MDLEFVNLIYIGKDRVVCGVPLIYGMKGALPVQEWEEDGCRHGVRWKLAPNQTAKDYIHI